MDNFPTTFFYLSFFAFRRTSHVQFFILLSLTLNTCNLIFFFLVAKSFFILFYFHFALRVEKKLWNCRKKKIARIVKINRHSSHKILKIVGRCFINGANGWDSKRRRFDCLHIYLYQEWKNNINLNYKYWWFFNKIIALLHSKWCL
jgi:hypothetical protein